MRSLAITGVALAALLAAQPACGAHDSAVGAPAVPVAAPIAPPVQPVSPIAVAPLPAPPPMAPDARWKGGQRAPGGWNAYRRPAYGYQLPRFWMAPDFYISDYRGYGLPVPASGFGWSRYYDDAVLTDQWGRVYDARSDWNWDDRRDSRRHWYEDSEGVAGGFAGAAAGAVAGNLIAGSGSRLAGSLIGGGVGALAGMAIEASVSKHHRHRHHDDRSYDDRSYDDRSYDDGYRGGYAMPHWGGDYTGGGYGYGYGYDAAPVVTTVVVHSAPVLTSRTVTTYENVYARRAAPRRHWKPRPKPACVCGS